MVLGPRRAEDVGEGVRDAGAELSRRVGGRGRVKKCHDLGLMAMAKEFNGYEFEMARMMTTMGSESVPIRYQNFNQYKTS